MANKAQANLKYYKGYGKNFKSLREMHQVDGKICTVRQLSEIFSQNGIGISYSTISDIENERREPTVEQVQIYHDFFKVPLDYLTGESESKSKELVEIEWFTGLSDKSLLKINKMARNRHFDWSIDVLNELIENEKFGLLIAYLVEYFTKPAHSVEYYPFKINLKDVALASSQTVFTEIIKSTEETFKIKVKEQADERIYWGVLNGLHQTGDITENEYEEIVEQYEKGNFDFVPQSFTERKKGENNGNDK